MALNGKLEELHPAEIFQLISLTRKNGKLVLTRDGRQGIVVFRNGRVVFAASDTLHTTLDSALTKGRVGADRHFIKAADRQGAGKVTDSGSFVVEVCETNADALEDVVRSQIEATVHELVKWRTGTFVFDAVELPNNDDIALETGWLEPGVDSDALVLNALTKLDEMDRGEWELDIEQAAMVREAEHEKRRRQSEISAAFEVLVDEDTGEIAWAPAGMEAPPKPGGDLERLRRIMSEMAEMKGMSPSLTAEVALLILRYSAQVLNRGVLFAVRTDSVRGIGQFGLSFDSESADARVRELVVPLDEPSVFERVVSSGSTFRGKAVDTEWNRRIVERLGGGEPSEVAVVPLLIEGSVVCILYGDNLPGRSVIGTVDGIEILMHEIGIAVEKARLERRLKVLESGKG